MSIKVHKGLWVLKCDNASVITKTLGIAEISKFFYERLAPDTVAFLDRDKDKIKSILRKEGIGFIQD